MHKTTLVTVDEIHGSRLDENVWVLCFIPARLPWDEWPGDGAPLQSSSQKRPRYVTRQLWNGQEYHPYYPSSLACTRCTIPIGALVNGNLCKQFYVCELVAKHLATLVEW